MLLNAFLPVTSESWWFISAYVILAVLFPVINTSVSKLGFRQEAFALFSVWLMWYSASAFEFRYSGIQRAVFFYMAGAFIQRRGFLVSGRAAPFVFILSWIMFAALDFASARFALAEGERGRIIRTLFSMAEISFCVPAAVFSLFQIFSGLRLGSSRIINTIAGTTFGVYLLHDSNFGRSVIWDRILHALEVQYRSDFFPAMAFCSCLAVFAVCSGIDFARKKFFEEAAMAAADKAVSRLRNI